MGERFHKSVIGAIGIGNVGQGNGLHAFKVRNLGSKFLVGAVAVGGILIGCGIAANTIIRCVDCKDEVCFLVLEAILPPMAIIWLCTEFSALSSVYKGTVLPPVPGAKSG